jgi:PAS domain S-box-containing protein
MENPPTTALSLSLIAAASSVVGAILALLGSIIVARIQARGDKRRLEVEVAGELHKSKIDADVNIAKIADARIKAAFEHQQRQIDELVKENKQKAEQIERDESVQRQNVEHIADLTHHSKTCEKVLKHTERQLRYYDETLGILRWEANEHGGLLYVNKNFLRCTGLTETDALKDERAWLTCISDNKREEVAKLWNELITGEINEFSSSFVFYHSKTKEMTAVTVDVESMFGVGDEVYKFIARTKPLYLINAELTLENKRLEDENIDLISRNLKLIGYMQEKGTTIPSLDRFIREFSSAEEAD